MAEVKDLFKQELAVINIGAELFKNDLLEHIQDVIHVDWQPLAGGDINLIQTLDSLDSLAEKIEIANQEAFKRFNDARPVLIDVQSAINIIPGMTKKTILHSGPPLTWEDMPGPMRGAVLGALIYEGLAESAEKAEQLALSGDIIFAPCNDRGSVGPMAGVISASMPVFVLENKVHGNKSFCNFNEGLGKVLRFGAYNPEVIERLQWMEKVMAPVLRKAIRQSGGIDIKVLLTQAIHMGDEGHNRNKAATSLFLKMITPYMLETETNHTNLTKVYTCISNNDHFFLNLAMPYCKAVLDAASGVPYSTLVVTMSRNGKDFGIRVSGLDDQWFTAPAEMIKGLLFPGFSEEDSNPDIGDSAITETAGLGGFAMAAAPAIAQFVGGNSEDAFNYSLQMYEITIGEHQTFTIPQFNFRGIAAGIDLRKVVETGVLPIINTGIAHKMAGIGQIGAGLVHPPMLCFHKALQAFAQKYIV